MNTTAICSICGEARPEEETLLLENRVVCASCKPRLVQQIQEGVVAEITAPIEIPSHRLGVFALSAKAWSVFLARGLTIVGVYLLTLIPYAVPRFLANVLSIAVAKDVVLTLDHFPGLMAGVTALIKMGVMTGAIFLISEQIAGRPISFGRALNHGLERWISAIWTAIVSTVVLALLFVLLVVPGLIWSGYYALAVYAVALRNCSGMTALEYSKSLVKGHWWYVFLIAICFNLASTVPLIVVRFLPPPLPHSEGINFVALCLEMVVVSFGGIYCTLVFLNLEKVQAALSAARLNVVQTAPPSVKFVLPNEIPTENSAAGRDSLY